MSELRRFHLDKLVHDGIVESNLSQGIEVEYSVLKGKELLRAILAKVHEEVDEALLATSNSDLANELSDISDLIEAAKEVAGVVAVRQSAHTFREGHFIHTVEVPADNEWADYYARQPERFNEITD